MSSNAARGARAKARTRKWLETGGFQVADMEVIRWVGKPGAKRFPIKRDQFASDLLAVNERGVVFVQVKSGKTVTGNFPDARRKFESYSFPAGTRRVVVAWGFRARLPRIVICGVGPWKASAHGEEEKEG